MKHTPGWYAKKTAMGQGLVIEEKTGRNVAVCYDEKDAPLVAAAPDLLEACRTLLEECRLYRIQGGAEEGNSRTMDKAHAALAKVEGRQ